MKNHNAGVMTSLKLYCSWKIDIIKIIKWRKTQNKIQRVRTFLLKQTYDVLHWLSFPRQSQSFKY